MTAISPKPSSAGGQMDAVLRNARPEISKDVQVQRLQAAAAKAGRRAGAPAMNLSVKEGNGLDVRFAHADQDAAGLLLMADLGTCDAAFVACAQGMSAREAPRLALKLSRLVRARCALNSRVRAGDPRRCAATAGTGCTLLPPDG